jgi:hypothetical protein
LIVAWQQRFLCSLLRSLFCRRDELGRDADALRRRPWQSETSSKRAGAQPPSDHPLVGEN